MSFLSYFGCFEAVFYLVGFFFIVVRTLNMRSSLWIFHMYNTVLLAGSTMWPSKSPDAIYLAWLKLSVHGPGQVAQPVRVCHLTCEGCVFTLQSGHIQESTNGRTTNNWTSLSPSLPFLSLNSLNTKAFYSLNNNSPFSPLPSPLHAAFCSLLLWVWLC